MPDAVRSVPRLHSRAAVVSGAILLGIVIGMTAANVWPVLSRPISRTQVFKKNQLRTRV